MGSFDIHCINVVPYWGYAVNVKENTMRIVNQNTLQNLENKTKQKQQQQQQQQQQTTKTYGTYVLHSTELYPL